MLISQCCTKFCRQIGTTGDLHLQPVINIPKLSSVSYTTGGRRPVHVALFALKSGQLGTILSVRCVRHALRLQNTRTYHKQSEWCLSSVRDWHTKSLTSGCLTCNYQNKQMFSAFRNCSNLNGETLAGDYSLIEPGALAQVAWALAWHYVIAQSNLYH